MESPEKYALPDASYRTLLGVFERLGDVIGTPGKKLILGRRRYTLRIGITTHTLTLSKRGISLHVMERSSTVARSRVSFPFHGSRGTRATNGTPSWTRKAKPRWTQ